VGPLLARRKGDGHAPVVDRAADAPVVDRAAHLDPGRTARTRMIDDFATEPNEPWRSLDRGANHLGVLDVASCRIAPNCELPVKFVGSKEPDAQLRRALSASSASCQPPDSSDRQQQEADLHLQSVVGERGDLVSAVCSSGDIPAHWPRRRNPISRPVRLT
jgi:hypothetical protein